MSAVQLAKTSARTYYHRFVGLGWSRVLLVLGVLFTLFSLASPVWFFTDGSGGTYTTDSYSWTTWTSIEFQNGVWRRTTTASYATFGPISVFVNALSGSYLLQLVFLIVLIGAVALFSLKWIDHWPTIGLLIVGLIVVVVAFVALLYPVFTVPSAAATDLGEPSITSFWGSAAGPISWGAGLGWWFLLIAVLLGIIGGVWPFLKSMRNPVPRPPPPREWQVER